MKRLTCFTSVLAGVAISAAGFTAAGAVSTSSPGPIRTGDTIMSSAAIRVTPSNNCVPVIHRNNAHPAPGIDRLQIVKGHARRGQTPDVLRVYMTHSSPVVHPEIQSDEVMGTYGISAGISGGIGHANIYFWDKNGKYVSPKKACGQSANWWISIESER